MKIGFALITSSPFFDKIINAENQLHDIVGFNHRLGHINDIPHTTLFQGTFDDSTDYRNIADRISSFYLNECEDRSLHFSEIRYIPYGWYFYTCHITDELKRLHKFTLEKCRPNIVLDPDRLDRDLSELTPEQIDGIEKYGYRYSGDAFFPHITLGRTNDASDLEIIRSFSEKLAPLDTDALVSRLTVYVMGSDGMHSDTLYECDLTGSY